MRRQQPPLEPRPGSAATSSGRASDSDDRAVLLSRAPDGAELEIRPVATSRGPRWTRLETVLGLGLVGIMLGGVLVNALSDLRRLPNGSPLPSSAPCARIDNGTTPSYARIRVVGDSGSGQLGRTGRTQESSPPVPNDWLLPRPGEGLVVPASTAIEAITGNACVSGWTLHAVPTLHAVMGTQNAMVLLGSASFPATGAALPLPSVDGPGDWTLRLAIAYETNSLGTVWSVKFYRLLIGRETYEEPVTPSPRPTAEPTPAITPAVACAVPNALTGPPPVNLVVGSQTLPGTIDSFRWFGTVAGPGTIHLELGPAIPFESAGEVQIGGDVCVTRWNIASMALPPPDSGTGGDIGESTFSQQFEWASYGSNFSDDPVISQQNRISVKTSGLGRTLVQATLHFADGDDASVYWLIPIAAFPAPAVRLSAPGGDSIAALPGCGASVSTSDNYANEECPPTSWPVLADGPILTARQGDVVTIDIVDWPLGYWGLSWREQSAMQAGVVDPPEIGSVGGHDSLDPNRIRWTVPPVGDWSVQLYLSHDEVGRQFSLPMYFRLHVRP